MKLFYKFRKKLKHNEMDVSFVLSIESGDKICFGSLKRYHLLQMKNQHSYSFHISLIQ